MHRHGLSALSAAYTRFGANANAPDTSNKFRTILTEIDKPDLRLDLKPDLMLVLWLYLRLILRLEASLDI
jgi:hypothetical protein